MPFLHIYNSACGLFSLGAFTDLHCVHCVSSFSSCWKEFRSWPSLLDFASSSSNQQCSFCCWKMVLDRTDPRYFARQCGLFFLCQRAFFFFFLHSPIFCQTVGEMGSFSCEMAQTLPGADPKGASVYFSQAVCLSCFHLQDTAKSQHFPLAYNTFFSSVPKLL